MASDASSYLTGTDLVSHPNTRECNFTEYITTFRSWTEDTQLGSGEVSGPSAVVHKQCWYLCL